MQPVMSNESIVFAQGNNEDLDGGTHVR